METVFNSREAAVIIVAGGSGTRMGSALPKQFLPIGGIPILAFTVNAFKQALKDAQIIVVAPEIWMDDSREVLRKYSEDVKVDWALGGLTRTDSVISGLEKVEPHRNFIGIQDAVRPFVSGNLINSCFEAAASFGNATPCVAAKDSYRIIEGNTNKVIDREPLRMIQTPQVFRTDELKRAYEVWPKEAPATDDATVFEASGKRVHLIEGEYTNIKITTPEDLEWANFWVGGRLSRQ